MARSYLDPTRPICALATPPGRGALALIRAAGPGCVELAARCFSRPAALRAARGHGIVHGDIVDPRTGERVDEVLAAVFRAPRSFTGEDQVEFSCHGSPEGVRRILEILGELGFAPALPGEFSFRAFANGKADLLRARTISSIASARSEEARTEALRRLEGGLSRRVGEARAALVGLLAEAEVRLDHAEEDGSPADVIPPAAIAGPRDSLAALAASFSIGRLRAEGARLALAGRPNAGKSSLFNLLLREERALVSPEAGTTRDWIEAGIEIAGFPLRLIDTAGLRAGGGAVEAAGVERSRRIIAEAELLLYVVDAEAASRASAGPGAAAADAEDAAILEARPDAILVWNKVDLAGALAPPPGALSLSAATGAGLPALHAAIEGRLRDLAGLGAAAGGGAAAQAAAGEEEIVVASARQKGLLDRAVAALDAAAAAIEAGAGLDAAVLDLREAAEALGEMTGEIRGPEVLEAIFSRFCLGK